MAADCDLAGVCGCSCTKCQNVRIAQVHCGRHEKNCHDRCTPPEYPL